MSGIKKIGDPIGKTTKFKCPYCEMEIGLKPESPMGFFEYICESCKKKSILIIGSDANAFKSENIQMI